MTFMQPQKQTRMKVISDFRGIFFWLSEQLEIDFVQNLTLFIHIHEINSSKIMKIPLNMR